MTATTLFEERDRWSGAILLSLGFHLLLAIAVIVGGYLKGPRGENWGGVDSGSSMQVGVVNSVPLPAKPETPNIVAHDYKGIVQAPPAKAQEEPQAIPIPEQQTHPKQQKPAVTSAPDNRRPTPQPKDNVVPSREEGGQINVAGAFNLPHIQGEITPDGDFGSRFAWYVGVVKNKVLNNWYTVEVSPGAVGHRAYVSFDISRDGTPGNVRLDQSSGIPALDQSAIRVLQRIETFGPLPREYSGTYVHVTLSFNYQG
jgi:periplasmic protein TonB